jgi:hypothetical protein
VRHPVRFAASGSQLLWFYGLVVAVSDIDDVHECTDMGIGLDMIL